MRNIFIGLLGDKVNGYFPHETAEKVLSQLAECLDFSFKYEWLPTDKICLELLKKYDCIWAGSGPYLNEEKALKVIQYAREQNLPTIGTCSGFKYMVIEYAKHVFHATHPFDYIGRNELCSRDYKDLSIELKNDCSLSQVYHSMTITEVSHCTFEIAPSFFEKTSTVFEFCGKAKDGRTVLIRLPHHPFYVASLFLPQLKSDSKLIIAWLKAALKEKKGRLIS